MEWQTAETLIRQNAVYSALVMQTYLSQYLVLYNMMKYSGPSCSNLTMSLVNVSLKFQTSVSEICQYFSLTKCEKLLQAC